MKIAHQTKLGTLYYGDADEVLSSLSDNSIALIYTDPPYPKKYFHCYEILAKHAKRLLVVGGSLVTIIPHYNAPEVINLFSDLKWRWLLHMNQWEGSHPRMSMGIEITFKPMGWWVNEKYPKERFGGFLRDGIIISDPAGQKKKLHKWEQSPDWGNYYIDKLTHFNDDVVLDPFIGSGTTAVICEKLGVNWIGIDSDLKAIETTIERLGGDYDIRV